MADGLHFTNEGAARPTGGHLTPNTSSSDSVSELPFWSHSTAKQSGSFVQDTRSVVRVPVSHSTEISGRQSRAPLSIKQLVGTGGRRGTIGTSQKTTTFPGDWQISQPGRQREIEAGMPLPLKNANTLAYGTRTVALSERRLDSRIISSHRRLSREPMSAAPMRSHSPSRRDNVHPWSGIQGNKKVDEMQSRTPGLSNQPLNRATSRMLENQASEIYTTPNSKASEAAMRNIAAMAAKSASQDEQLCRRSGDSAAYITKPRHNGRITPDQVRENRGSHTYALRTAHPPGISLNIGVPCIISVGPKRPRSRALIKYIGHISSVGSQFRPSQQCHALPR